LLNQDYDVGFNGVALAGCLVLVGIFAFLTQKARPKELLIHWEDTVELLIRDGILKRYLKFKFEVPQAQVFLAESRKFNGSV
jgi:hypothetical protein